MVPDSLCAMSDSDDLRLNELQRYRKTSSRLALEVHSHCEEPAGCGGVVLRWRRPGAPIGISLLSYVSGSSEGPFLDGKRFDEQRMTLAPGRELAERGLPADTRARDRIVARLQRSLRRPRTLLSSN